MRDNTIKDHRGKSLGVYEGDIQYWVDDYINSLEDPAEIKSLNKGLFTGMIKHIYINYFKTHPLDYSDIELLDYVFCVYTSLCYKYSKRPTILGYCLMTGIDNTTINTWKTGEYRGGLGSPHSLTAKKWYAECENSLIDGAIEQNGIGCIFALKANYGYTETAPAQLPYSGDQRRSIDEIKAAHQMPQKIRQNDTQLPLAGEEF